MNQDINNNICEKCNCSKIEVVKKGFSGQNAVTGFIAGFLLSAAIIYGVIKMNHPEWAYETAAILSPLPVLGLLYGTVKMNDIYSVCSKCGNRKLIYESKEPNIFSGEDKKPN